ncbi:hypothetical protein PO124_21505 [Bacillus licheniformis]|nr:hypothetical protein [Bacillus licheniformis]
MMKPRITRLSTCFLESLFPACSITMLGDLNQAILAHAYHDKTLLSGGVFEGEKRRSSP